MVCVAIGKHLDSMQSYTPMIEASSIEVQSAQGNTDDTFKCQIWDPLSTYPILAEDELVLLDETDPNGWPSTNLLTNGSFEGTYDGTGHASSWITSPSTPPSGITLSKSTANFLFGGAAQKIVLANAANGVTFYYNQQGNLPVTNSGSVVNALPYTFSFWYFQTVGFSNVTVVPTLQFWNANFVSQIGGGYQATMPNATSTGWQRISVSGLAPSGAATFKCFIAFTPTNATNSGTILLDGAQFEYNTYALHASSTLAPNINNTGLAYHSGGVATPGTQVLSVYATNTTSSDMPSAFGTAGRLLPTGGSVGTTTQTTLVGTSTGYGELYARGNTSAWPALGARGAPSGHGLVFDGTTLDGNTFIAGNWAPSVRLAHSGTAGTFLTSDVTVRVYVFDMLANTYTSIGSSTLTGQSIPSSASGYATFAPAAFAGAATYVGPNQRLYIDVWLNITANTLANATLTVNLGDLGTDAGKGGPNTNVATPGYQSLLNTAADGWFPSAVYPHAVTTNGTYQGKTVQNVSLTNFWSLANYLTANQSQPTTTTGFTNDGNITLAIDNTTSVQGTTSLKATSTATSGFQWVYATVPASDYNPNTPYTLSLWMKASTGTPTVRLYFQANNNASGNIAVGTVSNVTLSTSWTRYTVTAIFPSVFSNGGFAFTDIGLRVDTGGTAQAITWWMDGLQVEGGSVMNFWQVGGTNQAPYTTGVAQDLINFNGLANYTGTMTYQVTTALSPTSHARFGVNFEDTNGNPIGLTDWASANGLNGEGVSSSWRTISFRIGPNTPFPIPTGAAKFKVFCGIVSGTIASAVSGTIAIDGITFIPDAAQLQPPTAAMTAANAGVYPSPYIDESQAGNGTSSIWLDREVTNLYYRALRLFGGYVRHAKMNYAQGPERIWDIDAVDYGVIMSEAVVVLVVRGATSNIAYQPNLGLNDSLAIKQAGDYAHNQGYLKGLDYTTHVNTLTTIPAMAFNFVTFRDVMAAIADVTVGAFWVDPYKYLWYQAALAVSSAFQLSMTPDLVTTFPLTDWTLDYDSTQTRTTAIIQGSVQVSSPQTATFYAYAGTTQATYSANSTYSSIFLSPNNSRLSGYSSLQVGAASSGVLFALSSDLLPTPQSAPTLAAVAGTSTFASGSVFVSYTYTYNQRDYTGSIQACETAPSPQASVSVTGTGQVVQVSAITPPTSGQFMASDFTGINFYVSPSAGSSAVKFSVNRVPASGTVAQFNLTAYGTGATVPTTVPAYLLAQTTPTVTLASGTAANSSAFQVNGRLPIFSVNSITVNGVSQTIGFSNTSGSGGGFNYYSDLQPAQVTADASNYPANNAAIVVTFQFENPVMVRLNNPQAVNNTGGRLIAFYQNVSNIQSNADAIDQANAALAQYSSPQPIGHCTVVSPPAPPAQPLFQGHFVKITHPPSLGTNSPVGFQIQKATTKVMGNGLITRTLDLGYFRPTFANQMAQITQDAAHMQTDLNATSILNDVLSIQDSWTMTDRVTPTVGHQGAWAPAAAQGLSSGQTGSLWNDGTAWG